MQITMIADFGEYRTGATVTPPLDLAEWLVSRRYAEVCSTNDAAPALPAAAPKKGKK